MAEGEQSLRLLFADLHNHSLLSDGRGDPDRAFHQLREAGLDVAALTDHASTPRDLVRSLSLADYPDHHALAIGRMVPRSIDETAWKRAAELADAHDVPGEFTALRGFEWTEPWLGHVNVWFSETFLPVTTPGRLEGLEDFLAEREPQALYGYNHPGRESGRLGGFAAPARHPGLSRRMVALEAFNRSYDFLFEGHQRGLRSPIADCLDAGWRPALIGCSDEHGRSYGLIGKGRTGLWAPAHDRAGVRAALESRRCYATREVGLKLDATLDDVPMGGALRAGRTAVLRLDLAGSAYQGHAAVLQVLTGGHRPGSAGIEVVTRRPVRVGEPAEVTVEVPDDARWLIARVADERRRIGSPAPSGHPAACWALAYASPWYLL
jgi:hypothetical protein